MFHFKCNSPYLSQGRCYEHALLGKIFHLFTCALFSILLLHIEVQLRVGGFGKVKILGKSNFNNHYIVKIIKM